MANRGDLWLGVHFGGSDSPDAYFRLTAEESLAVAHLVSDDSALHTSVSIAGVDELQLVIDRVLANWSWSKVQLTTLEEGGC